MSDKSGTKYAQNARFIGRKSVSGPLNDLSLTHIVSDLQAEARKSNPAEELRCNLEFSDKHLLITYIKKDEGFESDGESTKSNEAVKIVFHDDSSSANSSGSDCDDLTKSTSTSASASPTSDLAKYKFDHKESYNMHDVLICHTTSSNHVVWVMRTKTGLEAMVIECCTEEEVKPLYKKFLDLNKRSKLERHRRRKSDGGSVVTRSMEAIFNGGRKREKSLEDEDRASTRFSLVQHTDRNGITHIEVEQPNSYIEPKEAKPIMGPSQQLVAKLRSSRSSAGTPSKKPSTGSEKSKFAKELESILSKELEARQTGHYRTRPPGESLSLRQRAPALLLRKLDEFEEKANQLWAKAEADEENRKIWNKPTVVIDPSKLASRTPPPRIKLAPRNSVDTNLQRKERLNRIKADLLNEIRPVTSMMSSHNVTTPVTSSTAVTATTATPTITTSVTAPTTPLPSKRETNDNVNKQILVPTKTGKEPVKKLYPKDQVVPEFLHHNRGPVNPNIGAPNMGHPGGPRFMLALPSPMQFTAQPHSLPLYPVTVAPMPPWARYTPGTSLAPPSGDFNDTNNNLGQLWAAIPMHRPPPQGQPVQPPHGVDNPRGRSRDRSRAGGAIDPDQRRRAQSKSPARIPVTDKSDLSGGLSRKFREFGDAVRQRISRKSGTANITVNQDESGAQLLKSNLKKKNDETSCGNGSSNLDTNNDNKKVHFNKFATVQMME